MKTLEEVQKFFENDRFATENGMVIDAIGENYAKCSMKIASRHKNAVGAVMGGVYFTLADFCYAVATNHQEPRWVSLNSTISFLGRPKGESLIATAICVKNGRSTNLYTVTVTDELENFVATVSITGFATL